MKAMFKKFLSVFLTITLVLGSTAIGLLYIDIDGPFSVKARAANVYKVGDLISFGSYPQTRILDEALAAELEKLTPDAKGDVLYEGNRYRKYTRMFGERAVTDFYLYEAIRWRVISVAEGSVEVLAESVLDQHVYEDISWEASEEEFKAVTWENCSLREWLNNDFYNAAFTPEEQAEILNTELDNNRGAGDEYNYDAYTGPNTTDKIYALSRYDMDEAHGLGTKEEIQKKATDFVSAKRIYGGGGGCSSWFLRSRFDALNAVYVDWDGFVYYPNYYCHSIVLANIGVAPALRLNLSSDSSFHPHSYEWVVEKEAAAGTQGKKAYKCSVCGDIERYEIIPATEAKNKVGDTISFGSYPQTKVLDEKLIAELEKLTPDAKGDVSYGGNKYRKYAADYYLYEPIGWKVISVDEGSAEMLAKSVLDQHVYDDISDEASEEEFEKIIWENCSLREWLNGEFYNTAFTDDEKAGILDTKLNNLLGPDDGYTGPDTTDKIYALSSSDMNEAHGLGTEEERQKKATDFASAKEIYVNEDGFSSWFLRSRSGAFFAGCVDRWDGFVNDYPYHTTATSSVLVTLSFGVAPALKLSLSSSIPQVVLIIGDIDEDNAITAADARSALRAAVGLEPLTDKIKLTADVDFDGAITAADARLILRAAVGLQEL